MQRTPFVPVYAADFPPGATVLQIASLLRRQGYLLGMRGLRMVKVRLH